MATGIKKVLENIKTVRTMCFYLVHTGRAI